MNCDANLQNNVVAKEAIEDNLYSMKHTSEIFKVCRNSRTIADPDSALKNTETIALTTSPPLKYAINAFDNAIQRAGSVANAREYFRYFPIP
jgi:hypothetical protein